MDPYLPTVKPFKTLGDVFSWMPGKDESSRATQCLQQKSNTGHAQKTLVCHDMAGGYLKEERYNQTINDSDFYSFYHWQYIDIFVYFSHHFVTIPPPVWTNAAHRHGVQVLGTIITEWDDGYDRCHTFLRSRSSYMEFVHKLVSTAVYYKFDGWLINIENIIEPEQIVNLIGFVTALTHEMHKVHRESCVLWYDSVTVEGKLIWQNELNDLNKIFFDHCDGIFLNYTWKDENLQRSAAATCRSDNVFVGVDVFGRGCYGGGGFNTDKALEKAREFGLSVAIFAPGWVYQKLPKEEFQANEIKFWDLLWPYLRAHSYSQLPLWLNFGQGQGYQLTLNGEQVSAANWCNYSLQSLQQQYFDTVGKLAELCMVDSYNGGMCMKLTEKQSHLYKLIDCKFEMKSIILLSYTYKSESTDPTFCLSLNLIQSSTEEHGSPDGNRSPDGNSTPDGNSSPDGYSSPDRHSTTPEHSATQIFLLAHGSVLDHMRDIIGSSRCITPASTDDIPNLTEYHINKSHNGWTTCYYVIPSLLLRCTGVNLYYLPEHDDESILLGQVQIMHSSDLTTDRHLEVQNLCVETCTDVANSLPIVLHWNFAVDKASHFNVYIQTELHNEPHFISQCASHCFCVISSCLDYFGELPDKVTLKFKVQPVLNNGMTYKLDTLPTVSCDYVKK